MKSLKVKSGEGIAKLRVFGGKAIQIITLRTKLCSFACFLFFCFCLFFFFDKENNFSLKVYVILGNF